MCREAESRDRSVDGGKVKVPLEAGGTHELKSVEGQERRTAERYVERSAQDGWVGARGARPLRPPLSAGLHT